MNFSITLLVGLVLSSLDLLIIFQEVFETFIS